MPWSFFRASKAESPPRPAWLGSTLAFIWGLTLIVLIALGTFSQEHRGALTWGLGQEMYATAVAVSRIEYGLRGGVSYSNVESTLFNQVAGGGDDTSETARQRAQNPVYFDQALHAASSLNASSLTSARDWIRFNDVGLAGFYELAFGLFGLSHGSFRELYVTFLAASFILFFVSFRTNPTCLAALLLSEGALFGLTATTIFTDLLPNLVAFRFLASLAFIPFTHIACALLERKRLASWQFLTVTLQAVLLVFVMMVRSTTTWCLIAAGLMTALLLLLRYRSVLRVTAPGRLRRVLAAWGLRQTVIVFSVLLGAWVANTIGERFYLDPVYFGDVSSGGGHVLWHNAWIALPLNPDWPSVKPYPGLPDHISDSVGFLVYQQGATVLRLRRSLHVFAYAHLCRSASPGVIFGRISRLWGRAPERPVHTEFGTDLSLEEARRLAASHGSSFAGQMAAGKAFLFGSQHTVSVVTEAERCFRRAFELEPESVEALTYVAFSLDNQGRWTEAKVLYEQALARDSSYELARERYQLALEELNIVDERRPATLRKSPFTRFPETLASLSDLEVAIQENVLSHLPDRDRAPSIAPDSRVVTIGSCFAANLANALTAEGLNAINLTVGEIINSTFANLRFFEWALGITDTISEEMAGRYPKEHVEGLLRDAHVVIYTLGVAPCFFEQTTGAFILPTKADGLRGVRNGRYIFRTTTVDENVANLRAIVSRVRDVNPGCQFVFSVSPVPLTATLEARSAMEADCLSKSILRVAVNELVANTPGCVYWPAFEIVRWLGAYVPGMYGDEDGTTHHVSERIVRLIMRLFLDKYGPAREPLKIVL